MKTEFEKMRSEELYDFSDPEIDMSLRHAKKLCARLQTMTLVPTLVPKSIYVKMPAVENVGKFLPTPFVTL